MKGVRAGSKGRPAQRENGEGLEEAVEAEREESDVAVHRMLLVACYTE